MAQIPYIFNQLISLIPKDFFDRLVNKYDGNKYIKDYTCWNHLLVMIWSQLTGRMSLRDIVSSLRVHSDKLFRMGIGNAISRNNISHASSTRNVAIFRDLAMEMMSRVSRISVKDDTLHKIAQAFKVSGFFAIDSSTISLPLDKFPWSIPQKNWGGVKLHTMYDQLREVPRICLITCHQERDQTFMDDYPYEEDCFYVFDKMYFKTTSMYYINACKAFFVTRIKDNVRFDVIKESPVDGVHVLADKTIQFSSRWAHQGYPGTLRLVYFYSSEKNAVIKFVTNNFTLDAATIALLYKYRWQIELFFRWIKQHLRITKFFGTTANAVYSQIYIALITFCILALAADRVGHKGSIYEFANLISVTLTEKTTLKDLITRYREGVQIGEKPDYPSLFDFDNLSESDPVTEPLSDC